ncbi:MAG: MBL fold metallo-hydrolase [Opitutaceae bacterium]|jgi:L-ascorbate metabolism protein UlaG (beta-lactamase superfamily)
MPAPFPLSDHCDGRRFFNPRRHDDRTWLDVWRWKRAAKPGPWPSQPALPRVQPTPLADDRLAATWIGQSTFLLQTRAGTVLTDPVFSDRVGPTGRIGPRRARAPGIAMDDLPAIDVVLLSHDHYDHCDRASLRRLWQRHAPLALTPLGNAPLLRSAGFAPNRIIELDWWQSHPVSPGLNITLTPARHWSNRLRGPRNGRLWGGFFLNAPDASVFFAGDTAYDDTFFRDIRQKLGAPDLALIPIGAYAPRWFMKEQHCDPSEAVQIHRELEARLSVAMHWGTFPLTDEGFAEPPLELARALAANGLPSDIFRVTAPGETLRI